MTTTYGNRGRRLERAVRRVFAAYTSRGIHCQQNHPEQTHAGTLVRAHGFDFQMLYKGKFYAFDAKECASLSWPLEKAKPHQLKALLDVAKNGGEAFFLVYFTGSQKLVKFPAELVRGMIAKGATTLAPAAGTPTTLNLLGVQ